MRVSSLVILLAIVGGIAYVAMFTDWFSKGRNLAEGYTAAKTPEEAVTLFAKAVKARRAKVAAMYCTEAYAEQLKKAHEAVAEVGPTVDKIREYAKNKGWQTDKALAVLHYFDPLPAMTPSPVKKVDDKSADVKLDVDDPGFTQLGNPQNFDSLKGFRPTLFSRPLLPAPMAGNPAINLSVVKIVKVGEEWKLDVVVSDVQKAAITDYLNNYKSLRNGLDAFRQDLVSESRTISTKADFENRLNTAVTDSK